MTEAEKEQITGRNVLLYDGHCGLCNRVVRFCLKHDSEGRLRYAPLQGSVGKELLARYGQTPERLNSVGLVTGALTSSERFFSHSDAVARALQDLALPWAVTGRLLARIPRWLRDPGYRMVSAVRYRVFGHYATCPLPDQRARERFVGVEC